MYFALSNLADRTRHSALCVLGVILAGVYMPVIAGMAKVWWTDPYAIHGLFVPFFSGLMLWHDRERIKEAAREGDPRGLILVLSGLGLLLLGKDVPGFVIQTLSLVVSVSGLVLWGFGVRCLKAAAFPIAFLLLMTPPPRVLISSVTMDLQLFASGFAGIALEILGLPYSRKGVFLELPNITLQVAEICNGLRFMLSLLTLTLAFAHVSQATLVRKLILVGSAVPAAVLANAVRVAVIVIAVHFIGVQAASGVIHHSIGKVIWALTLVPLCVLGLLLKRSGGAGSQRI